ncbi:MAG: zf-HC2 domain-containing protein, partial [Ignavibacteriales bacterium]|nr:zf-HC2 domain-containing protein [Ignavibacteriales bacterium]
MNCEQITSILPGIFDTPLSPPVKKEFDEHLRVCHQCTVKYNKMKNYFEKVQELPATIPLPKIDQDELIRRLQKDLGTGESVKTTNENSKEPVSKNLTAEFGRVETIYNKKKRTDMNPMNKNILFFFIGVFV